MAGERPGQRRPTVLSLARESEQAVNNKNGFSQPTLSLDFFWFHWFHVGFTPGQEHPSPGSYSGDGLRTLDAAKRA